MLSCIIFTVLLIGLIPLGQISFNSEAAAEHKEYETEGFSVNITIPKNTYKSVDVSFITGNSLEVVYTLQVKDNLPVDAWFVNNDNYLLLSGDAQFLFFMDGTGQQVSYMKRIVTLTKYDNYKLVITNYYANQTVEVNIFGEVRTYFDVPPEEPPTEDDDVKEDSTEYPPVMYYSLAAVIAIIIILLIIVIILYNKLNEAIHGIEKVQEKQPSRKPKNKPKARKDKAKAKAKPKPKPEAPKRAPTKKAKPTKEKEKAPPAKKPEDGKESNSVMFCGHCGAPTETPFCKKCGKKA